MDLIISISGIRGIFGKSLSSKIIFDFGRAFFSFLLQTQKDRKIKLVIGRDARKSGSKIKRQLFKAFKGTGAEIFDLGICPTPVVLFMVRKLKANGGIVITASHNPLEWNGLKFINEKGSFLNSGQLKKLCQIKDNRKFYKDQKNKKIVTKKTSYKEYLDHVLKNLNTKKIKEKRFKVAIDCCNGAGSEIFVEFLKKLYCQILPININPNGVFPHDPEPKPETLKQLCRLVNLKKADIGFMQDPDGDRLAIVSEKAEPISEEKVLSLAVKYVLSKRKGDVIINLSTSRMIENIVADFNRKVFRAPVGEINVVSEMRKRKAVIGGEGNGGVIYPKMNFGRDSLVAAGLILEYMADERVSISKLLDLLPKYFINKTKISYPREKIDSILLKLAKKFHGGKIDLRDGLRIDWHGKWLHIRLSNTEPVVRLIVEADSEEKTKKLNQEIINFIKKF